MSALDANSVAWEPRQTDQNWRPSGQSAELASLYELLSDARFAIETTVACLNTWNGNRGGPADTDGIIARIDARLEGSKRDG